MGDERDPKAELRGFAKHIQGLSDEELDEIIGGWGGSVQGHSGSVGMITRAINQYLQSK